MKGDIFGSNLGHFKRIFCTAKNALLQRMLECEDDQIVGTFKDWRFYMQTEYQVTVFIERAFISSIHAINLRDGKFWVSNLST